MSKSMYFFATRVDMESGIKNAEVVPLMYAQTGVFPSPQYHSFLSALLIPDIGRALHGHQNLEKSYLVVRSEQKIEVRTINHSDGRLSFAIDQLHNPHSIVFQPSGVYGSSAVIMGALTTVSSHPDALTLYTLFSQKLRHGFQKINNAYVGPEAFVLAKKGYRLTNDVNRPMSYDTKI